MKKILFPTDFSDCSENAFRYVIPLAEKLGARVDLVSIYSLPLGDASSVPPEFIERMLREKQEATLQHLRNFSIDAPKHVLGEIRADYGIFIYQEVADIARDKEYDLIVMGTKGQHNAMEKLMGSVTTHTMLHAPCPVMAIPQDAEYQPIHQIAFATNFMPNQDQAFKELAGLSAALGAKMEFVHVDTKGNSQLEGKMSLSELPEGFDGFSVVYDSSAMGGMETFIKSNHIDLLALFIPQRRLWERLFHSSFTKKMTFHTKIPLVVFSE